MQPDEKRFEFYMPGHVERYVREHEIFMSFENDVGAEAFQEWIINEGEHAFKKWAEEHYGTTQG